MSQTLSDAKTPATTEATPIYYGILTDQGQALLASAIASGIPLPLTQMAVGDGAGQPVTPQPEMTELVNEVHRAPLNQLFVDPTASNEIVAEMVMDETTGGFWIRELGLYDETGALFAVANAPDSYKPVLAEGAGRALLTRMILIVSDTSAVELIINPDTVMASRAYVDAKIAEHAASRDHPAAAEGAQGMIPLATPTMVAEGIDHASAVTPAGAAATYAKLQHEHEINDILWLQEALDEKAEVGHTHTPEEAGAAPTEHGHEIEDVSGLQEALDGKAESEHQHEIDEVNGLQEVIDEGDKLHISLPFDFAFNVGWTVPDPIVASIEDAPAGYPCPKLAALEDSETTGNTFRGDIATTGAIPAGAPFMDGGAVAIVIDTEGVGNAVIDFYIIPMDAAGEALGDYGPAGFSKISLIAGANDTQHRAYVVRMTPHATAAKYKFRFRVGSLDGNPFEGIIKIGIGAGSEWLLQYVLDNKADTEHAHTPDEVGSLPSGAYNPRSDSLNNTEKTVPVYSGDLDDLVGGDFVVADMRECTNTPDTPSIYLYIETRTTFSGTALLQTAWPYAAADADDEGGVWTRIKTNNGVWKSWVRLYDTKNPPTAAAVEAFPNKAGSTTEDVFTRDPGVYDISEPASTPNWPHGDTGGSLLVQKHGAYRTRIAIEAGGGSMSISAGTEAAPSSWRKIYDTLNPPDSYDGSGDTVDVGFSAVLYSSSGFVDNTTYAGSAVGKAYFQKNDDDSSAYIGGGFPESTSVGTWKVRGTYSVSSGAPAVACAGERIL